MTSLVWFVSACSLIRKGTKKCFRQVIWGWRGQGIILKFIIFLCCMDMFLFLCLFHWGFFSLLIFRKLLILIHTSVHFRLFFCCCCCCVLLICLSYIQASSQCWRYSPLLPHCIIMTQWISQSFLRLIYHAHHSKSLWMLILSGWYQRASLR